MIRLIGLDLDGTLLTRDKRLTDRNKEALSEAWKRGIEVVPVTGRPRSGIPREVTELPFIHYTITSNGAVTFDRKAGKAVRERYMTVPTAISVLEKARGDDIIREYFTGGFGFHDEKTRELLRERFGKTPVIGYLRQSRKLVEDFRGSIQEVREGIENISIMCRSPLKKEEILGQIRDIRGIRIIYPWPTDLEITSDKADKGEALLELGRMLGIGRDEIMAMGDGNNDLGLMKAAGLSVAMGNSDPEILQVSDYVTKDNDHDGVAEAIRQYALS